MALYDTDSKNFDRGAPMPSSHDVVPEASTMAHKTLSTHYNTAADTNLGRLQFDNKRILANDGTNPRGLYGYNSALGLWGFFLTQAGTDVTTNTDTSKFIFNSNQDVFKIVLSGTTTVTTPASMTNKQVVTATIPHGLSVTPAFLAYVNVPNLGAAYVGVNALQGVPFTLFTYNITPILYVYGAVDSTNLTLNIANLYDAALAGVGGVWTFKYYILQETAT